MASYGVLTPASHKLSQAMTQQTGGKVLSTASVMSAFPTGRLNRTHCAASVGAQHSHLEEAIREMQLSQERAPDQAQIHQQGLQPHVFRGSNRHGANRVNRGPQLSVPHLDGMAVDAADALRRLRHFLLEHRSTAIVSADETGPAILDLISMLILLGEDAAQETPGSCVLFQPIIDIRNKVLGSHERSAGPNQPAIVAAIVTRARCPKLASRQPVSCITATSSAECAHVATAIAHAAQSLGSTRFKVVSNAMDLVEAWRALRRARAIVRARSQGTRDLLMTPHLAIEQPVIQAPIHVTPTADDEFDAIHGVHASASSQAHQQAVMFFDVWLRFESVSS